MKCKPLVSSLTVVMALMCVLLTNLSASAHTAMPAHSWMPANYDCTGGCTSFEYWNGGTYGGKTTFTIDNPSFNNTTSSFYMKFLRLGNQTDNAHLDVGIVKNTNPSPSPYCNSGDTRLQEFIYAWDANLNRLYKNCSDVPTGDFNTEQEFAAILNPNCNADGGFDDEYLVSIAGVGFCVDVETQTYNREILQAEIFDSVSGHQVWGGLWLNNSWANGNFNYVYQGRATDAYSHQGAMRMYWNPAPNGTNHGGNLNSCVYEVSLGHCNYGS